MMQRLLLVGLLLLASTQASANVALSSETGHLAGGMVLGLGATWVADHYRPEHRVLIGFVTVLTIAVAEELRQKASTTSNHISALDIATTAAGGALGAVIGNRYLLRPVVTHTDGKVAVGLRLGVAF